MHNRPIYKPIMTTENNNKNISRISTSVKRTEINGLSNNIGSIKS